MAPEDQTFIYRLVGFYEYLNALQNLDALARMITDDERKAIDDIIKDHDEFAVFTNLSRRVQNAPSSLAETSPQGNGDRFERRGLNWVLALARVEVGAMLAGFTRVSSPFEIMRPTKGEMPAYAELLLDGTRTHYWTLAQDKMFRQVVAKSLREPGADTLAYVRRLTMARAFHQAAAKIAWQDYSTMQQAELTQWQRDLDKLHKGLSNNIQANLSRQKVTQRKVVTSSKDNQLIGRFCRAQLDQERYEIEAGSIQFEIVDSLE